MATVRQFEDLLAWQRARTLTKEVYAALLICEDRGFTDQIERASVSVMSNIAEGFESGTKQTFLNYLYIAKGSAGEVRAQLYVALDVGYISEDTFTKLHGLVVECSKLIASFIMKLKQSEVAGLQRKTEKTKRQIELDEFQLGNLEQLAKSKPEIYQKLYEEKKQLLSE